MRRGGAGLGRVEWGGVGWGRRTSDTGRKERRTKNYHGAVEHVNGLRTQFRRTVSKV